MNRQSLLTWPIWKRMDAVVQSLRAPIFARGPQMVHDLVRVRELLINRMAFHGFESVEREYLSGTQT